MTDARPVHIAMRYVIPLQQGQAGAVRVRVAQIGPSFDALPGLVAKLFLLADDETPTYSLFYIWRSPAAMRDFLAGEGFAAVVAKYGRPTIETFLTTDDRIDLPAGERVAVSGSGQAGLAAAVRFDDPATGKAVTLVPSEEGRHEVLFVARPR